MADTLTQEPREEMATGRPAAQEPDFPEIGVRRFGMVNWIGLWTLYHKEVSRFLKVAAQTVIAPVVTTLLFLAVFSMAFTSRRPDLSVDQLQAFIAPGLIMMAILQNAFANSSSSLLISKVQGNIVDVLMPPLSAGELAFAFVMGAVTRGLVCAIATFIPMAFFVPFEFNHIWAILYFAVGASMTLSLMGLMAGMWAEKFDHLATITNFAITPLSLLSGTFYSITVLPQFAQDLSHWNPFFYFIDGFRYGFTGAADGNVMIGVALTFGLNLVLTIAAYRMLASGYRLKA